MRKATKSKTNKIVSKKAVAIAPRVIVGKNYGSMVRILSKRGSR